MDVIKNYKLIIFDWDGTLMDSIERIVTSVQASALIESMEPPSAGAIKGAIGLSLPKVFEKLFPDVVDEQLEKLIANYKQHYLVDNSVQATLFEHAFSLLEQLRERDKIVTIATGKARVGLDKVLQETQTSHLFHSTKCSDEYTSKPHPHMVHSLLEEFSIAPEHAVMIGDSTHDMGMAKSAGVDRIGITHGVHGHEELSAFEPRAVVNDIFELKTLLLRSTDT